MQKRLQITSSIDKNERIMTPFRAFCGQKTEAFLALSNLHCDWLNTGDGQVVCNQEVLQDGVVFHIGPS